MSWEALLRVLVSGIANGAIYASVAVGFSIIYRSGKVFNIAQGEMLMLATFIAMTFFGMGINHWVALALTALVMALLGLGVERFVLRPLVGQSEMALFMATLGLLLVLNGLGVILFGTEPRLFPDVLGTDRWQVGTVSIKQSAVLGTLLIAGSVALLAWFFRSTRTGLFMTAVAESHQIARSLGVNVRRSIGLSWAIAGVMATIAAAAFMSGHSVSPEIASIAFVALPVVLLSGLETVGGVMLGGMIVGIGQSMAAAWLDPYTEGGASLLFPFALMMLILLFLPQGLFGWKRVERI
jgi:branched-chain amino acid transport system permease protein